MTSTPPPKSNTTPPAPTNLFGASSASVLFGGDDAGGGGGNGGSNKKRSTSSDEGTTTTTAAALASSPRMRGGAKKGGGGGLGFNSSSSSSSSSSNLFGSTTPPPPPSSLNGGGNDNNNGTNTTNTTNNNSGGASSWFEEDDQLLLTQLLLGDDSDDSHSTSSSTSSGKGNELDKKLNALQHRLIQDVSRGANASKSAINTTNNGDAWWNLLVENANSAGFTIIQPSFSSLSTSFIGGSAAATGNNNCSSNTPKKTDLPKSFHTVGGQIHLRALQDLLGIDQERAVKITLSSLRTFASVSESDGKGIKNQNKSEPVNSPGGEESDKENDNSKQDTTNINNIHTTKSKEDSEQSLEYESKLRSLLGTTDLFHRVLVRHQQQFLARLRVVTESLRLEQESKEDVEDDGNGSSSRVGKSCAKFLNGLDGNLSMNGNKRGLFQLLVRLATGPSLPGLMGRATNNTELPYSVSKLRRSGGNTQGGSGSSSSSSMGNELLLAGSEESLLAIRNEAAEALLVLLYDRIDGGVQRSDLFLILAAAESCGEYEFGMSAGAYSQRGGSRGGGLGFGGRVYQTRRGWQHSNGGMDVDGVVDNTTTSPMMLMDHMKCRLNGLLALICAECMGLWRANTSSNDGGNDGWVGQHPFFAGLDLTNNATGVELSLQTGGGNTSPSEKAKGELEVLYQKLVQLGQSVKERRQAAYSSRNCQSTSGGDIDDDDELWGVQAPEGVALLTFSLLLSLAHTYSSPSTNEYVTKLGEWGNTSAQMANDDCAAFAYLHRVLEWMVLDPITHGSKSRRLAGNDLLIKDILSRGEIELISDDDDKGSLAIMDEGMEEEGDYTAIVVSESDAASIVYASIGREILSATVRAFRDVLLSLTSHSAAVENIGMLAGLASVIYRNEKILCEQFWLDWEDFCQGGGNNMDDGGESSDEPMCYLLDASHSLAVNTLEELKAGGSQQAIIHYLKPLSTFLHLIASLCASPSMVESILTSEFLPDSLLFNAMAVVAQLAPLITSLNESADGGHAVSSEERSTIRHATTILQSISTLTNLGGKSARDWIRKVLQQSGPARMVFNIASHALPRTHNSLEGECTSLSSSALNLLVDLLVDANVTFQMETCRCFLPSSSTKVSGFSQFSAGNTQGEIALGSMGILNCLALNLTKNVFDTNVCSSGAIETVGGGVMVGLDVLATFVSSGEVSFQASNVQVATVQAILSSIVATLSSLKQIIYLHEDDEVRSIALAIRNDVITALSSSTPLGQVIAFLASAPIALNVSKQVSSSKELVHVMDSASSARYHQNKGEDSKYGAWGKFVTPKRARQRASRRASTMKPSLFSDNDTAAKDDSYSDLYDVVVSALALLLVWGDNAEDMASISDSETDEALQNSPCALLLSRASSSSSMRLDVANLNLISRLISTNDAVSGGAKSDASLLSAKVVKMCLRQGNDAFDMSQQPVLSTFRAALGGGSHMFKELLAAFDILLLNKKYLDNMEQLVLMASVMLEAVSICVSSQPDLARSILLGGDNKEDWRLIEKVVSCVLETIGLMNEWTEEENSVDNRVLNLRCLLACSCLHVISKLWTSCRLTIGKKKTNLNSVHACGMIVSYLTDTNNTLIANIIVELTRSSLLLMMSLDDKQNKSDDSLSTSEINQKCIVLDLLTQSLDIVAIETVCRAQTKSQGGIKFVEDLFDSGPMECWKSILLGSEVSASAASSWLDSFSSAVGRSNAPNWNMASFLQANPGETETSMSSWCSFGSAAMMSRAISPYDRKNTIKSFRQCNALQVLAKGDASLSASWANFFGAAAANVIATCPSNQVLPLANALTETTVAAISSISESNMISQSLLSCQGLIESQDTTPVGELCSLLLYSLTIKSSFIGSGESQSVGAGTLEQLHRLFESANKLFAMTQLGSVSSSNQESVCFIRQRLLTSALVLLSEYEGMPDEGRTRGDTTKYDDLRLGFADLAITTLQSLQYAQLGVDNNLESEEFMPSKYGYSFGATSENSLDPSSSGQEAALQLLRSSLSLLTRLAPTSGASSKPGNYQTYAYGADFASCLKKRDTFHLLENHLKTASMVASMTYHSVHAGSSTHSVTVTHNNSVDIVCLITSFFHALADSGSAIVEILLILMESRFFRSLIDNPLLKTASKMWVSSASMETGDGVMPTATFHRGYYTSIPSHAGNVQSPHKRKPSSRKDPVHFIWREVINIFTSLLGSARHQCQVYAKVDEPIIRQLLPATSVVLDFLCTYQSGIFSCFSSMANEARSQSSLLSRGGKAKSSSFSSSMQLSSFAFTPNLLKEAADIFSLFSELCKGENKNQFARQCGIVYERVRSISLEATKIMSSFLGSIGNARELFLALSSASSNLSNPSAMYDAHPLLADGIPNARHEAIRNAHFAHSCCVLATAEDFANSHVATTKAAETAGGKDKSLEQSFQIHVNNKCIAEIEEVAGHCLFNSLAILSDTHPASDSFVTISSEEASRLDVAAIVSPGTTVAICPQTQQYLHRYCTQSQGEGVRYARIVGCDRSTKTISVEYLDSGATDVHVSWSQIVGIEDVNKTKCILSYSPTPKSVADEAGTSSQTSVGHLILALRWCRHIGFASLDPNPSHCPLPLVKCVAERTAILLCTEVLLHDELQERSSRDDMDRKINMQLLDLFDSTVSNQGDKTVALVMGEDLVNVVQMNLKSHLESASHEREEEQRIWEQNNQGWDNTSFLGTKRQGRRSPFRLMRKTSSDFSS